MARLFVMSASNKVHPFNIYAYAAILNVRRAPMNYKHACLMSWGLVALAALTVVTILSSIDLSGFIYGMLGV